MNEKVLDVHEKPATGKWITLSLQHMFAMFGATILVPQLVGLSPAIALLTSGIATIVFIISYTISSSSIFRLIVRFYHPDSSCDCKQVALAVR